MTAAPTPSSELTVIAPKPAYSQSLLDQVGTDGSLADSLRSLLFRQGAARGRLAMERRATPRLQAEIICVERMAGTRFLRTTYDLSTFGLSTQYGHRHPLGTELDLEIQLPDDCSRPLLVRAKVVGHNARSGGMRLAFKHPSRDTVRRLYRFLFLRMEAQGNA
ncbi:MAG TPA: PilZ domain-containing protein [Myxococcales bacterium]|jgi:hypothetical protein|nr:PilZ domain-containing protein [Myxococcales bacterium]